MVQCFSTVDYPMLFPSAYSAFPSTGPASQVTTFGKALTAFYPNSSRVTLLPSYNWTHIRTRSFSHRTCIPQSVTWLNLLNWLFTGKLFKMSSQILILHIRPVVTMEKTELTTVGTVTFPNGCIHWGLPGSVRMLPSASGTAVSRWGPGRSLKK